MCADAAHAGGLYETEPTIRRGVCVLHSVRVEEIYDAAVDDDAFGQLASRLAEAVGARSGVLHWRDPSDGAEDVSYSGYFSYTQMAAFERDFADCDLWSAAIRQQDRTNRAWNCDEFVAPAVYERSRIYNEWIRPMGDDTFHCLGASIRTPSGIGEIGFHRGKSQPAFDDDTVQAVNAILVHFQRMVVIRSKLRAAGRTGATLDVTAHAVFTLGPQGRVLDHNAAADAMLRRDDGLMLRGDRLAARSTGDQNMLHAAIARATSAEGAEACALLVHRTEGPPYEVSVASVHKAGLGRHVVVLVTDRTARDASLESRVRNLYGLTQAEAEVAVRLTEGASVERLSTERGVAIGTVRTQIKSIAAKMGCSRQSELVANIGNLPRLHEMR